MAEQPRKDDDLIDIPRPNEASDIEHDGRDRAAERAGESAPHTRRSDEAARGIGSQDVDPDSAESDVDRDDTATD